MLEGIWKAFHHLWLQWKNLFNTYQISCLIRCMVSVDFVNIQQVDILWKWLPQENLVEQSGWTMKPRQLQRRKGRASHGVWIFNNRNGVGWQMEMSEHCVSFLTLVGLTFQKSDAHVFFKAGKTWDGFFDANDLLQQVENAIDIFESRTNGFVAGLFLFNNAPSHQRWAPDACSAWKMPKGPHTIWCHHKDGLKMRPGNFGADNTPQDFYFMIFHEYWKINKNHQNIPHLEYFPKREGHPKCNAAIHPIWWLIISILDLKYCISEVKTNVKCTQLQGVLRLMIYLFIELIVIIHRCF